jgi:DnaK suppressor protein
MLNKSQLFKYKQILVMRRNELVLSRQNLKKSWDKIHKTEKDIYDQAGVNSILSELSRHDERNWNELREIDRALDRIAEGEYGICVACDEPISSARIKVLPYALMCVTCAQEQERSGAALYIPKTKSRTKKPSECQKMIDRVISLLKEDGRISDSRIEIQCMDGHMIVSGSLSNELEQDILQEIVENVSGTDEHIFDLLLEEMRSDEDLHGLHSD